MKITIKNAVFELTEEEGKDLMEQLNGNNGRWKPKREEYYWFPCEGTIQKVDNVQWFDTLIDRDRFILGNCFPSEEAAKMHKLRLQSIAEAWWPEVGEEFWYWSFENKRVRSDKYHFSYFPEKYIGSCHPTEEACEEWHKKFGIAFDYHIKNK
jgi:hypothetical protein